MMNLEALCDAVFWQQNIGNMVYTLVLGASWPFTILLIRYCRFARTLGIGRLALFMWWLQIGLVNSSGDDLMFFFVFLGR